MTASKIEHISSPLRVACPARHPILFYFPKMAWPVPVAARSKALACGHSLAENVVSNPTAACISVVGVVCCQVEVSATG